MSQYDKIHPNLGNLVFSGIAGSSMGLDSLLLIFRKSRWKSNRGEE